MDLRCVPCRPWSSARVSHRVDLRQVPDEATPGLPAIAARPYFAGGSAEVNTRARVRVDAHGLPQHREPGLRPGQTPIEAPPALAGIGGRVDRRPPVD